jgi:hypothetical protein
MFRPSSRTGNAVRAAAISITALLGAANTSNAQQLALDGQPPAAKLVPPGPGQLHVFTPQECQLIAGTSVYVVRDLGNKDRLSPEFKQSFRNFLGANLTCDGPREIAWRTREDAATFNDIASQLMRKATRISLREAGVNVAPTPVGLQLH